MTRSPLATACPMLILLTLPACTDPMRYTGAVEGMRAGTDHVAVVVGESIRHVEVDPQVQRQFCLVSAAAAGVRLQTAAAEAGGDAASGPCAVAWREADDAERVASAALWIRHDTILAVTEYVHALEALMHAPDEGLGDAAAELALAVDALEEAAAKLPGNGRLPDAVDQGLGLFADLSADLARLEALQRAVSGADPVMGRLVRLIADDVEIAHAVRIGRAPVEYENALSAAIRPVSTASGLEVLALPTAVAEFRASDPAEAVRKLGMAHAALLRAVTDNSTKSFIELTFAVDDFAQAAREVWQVYGAYATALER